MSILFFCAYCGGCQDADDYEQGYDSDFDDVEHLHGGCIFRRKLKIPPDWGWSYAGDPPSHYKVRASFPDGLCTLGAGSEIEALETFDRIVRETKASRKRYQICLVKGRLLLKNEQMVCPPGTLTYDYRQDIPRILTRGHTHRHAKEEVRIAAAVKVLARAPGVLLPAAWDAYEELRRTKQLN